MSTYVIRVNNTKNITIQTVTSFSLVRSSEVQRYNVNYLSQFRDFLGSGDLVKATFVGNKAELKLDLSTEKPTFHASPDSAETKRQLRCYQNKFDRKLRCITQGTSATLCDVIEALYDAFDIVATFIDFGDDARKVFGEYDSLVACRYIENCESYNVFPALTEPQSHTSIL